MKTIKVVYTYRSCYLKQCWAICSIFISSYHPPVRPPIHDIIVLIYLIIYLLGVGIFKHFTIRSDSGSHDPIPKRFLIYIFSPINSSAVQIHLYNFTSYCHLKSRGVNLGFTIQFNYDYHYQLNITMCHILSSQYYCTWLHFHINFKSNLFCAKFTLLFLII